MHAAPLGHKDIRLTLAAAEDLRVPMPLACYTIASPHMQYYRAKIQWCGIGSVSGTVPRSARIEKPGASREMCSHVAPSDHSMRRTQPSAATVQKRETGHTHERLP